MKYQFMPRATLTVAAILLAFVAKLASAEVTLTIVSPAGSKEIALTESPEIVLGYDESGMTLEFKNLNLVTQCIGGDISSDSGLCLLKTYNADQERQSTMPGTPGTPSVAPGSPGQVQLSWTAPASEGSSAITGYQIEANVEGTSSWTRPVPNTQSATPSYTVQNLQEGESYRFRVAAINAAGTGSNSGLSPYVTVPTSEDGLTLAQACINAPAIVECDKTRIPANFYQVWGTEDVIQPPNKVFVMPFIVEETTTATGDFAKKTFMSSVDAAADYSFSIWISETPNGERLGNQQFCSMGGKTAAQVSWTQSPNPAYGQCGLGSANRILYVNAKLFKRNSDGTETLYPYNSPTNRQARWSFSNSVTTFP